MGGHGGLNILPQKSWNVYNYENREKVRRDEEAAAKEEQLKQDQSRKRDAEFRLETLRQARGIHAPRPQSPSPSPDCDPNSNSISNSNSKHINLFEGLKTFPFSGRPEDDVQEDGPNKQKRQRRNDAPAAKVVLPEDEKYRLGYGVAGKGVKAPWYLSRTLACEDAEDGNRGSATAPQQAESNRKASGKKTLEELREERMKREKQEKERERSLLSERKKRDRASARLR